MEPRRAVAISSDKALRRRLQIGLLAAGAAVELFASPDELPKGRIDADLVVVHGVGAGAVRKLAKRLAQHARLILILPQSDLEAVVAAMQTSERIAAVLVADGLEASALTAAATRVLYGDLFGLDKLVPWGTRVHSMEVGSYQDKAACIAALAEFAQVMGVRRKYREAIEQCADEMLMNALYDAPVDERGKPLFAEVPIKERLEVELERKAVVEYAADEGSFYLAVRDHYGTLDRATVLRYLDKCLHAEEQIDRKTGGAGLGLYLMASSTSTFLYNVHPGVATECVVTFDLRAPKVQVENVAFHTEREDGAAQNPAASAARAPSSPFLVGALSVAVVLLLGVIALLAYPRFFGQAGEQHSTTDAPGDQSSAVGEPRSASAAVVQMSSDPPGATVLAGDRELGTTPLPLTDLPPGEDIDLIVRKRGFRQALLTVHVPEAGGTMPVHTALELARGMATVRLETEPPGARIYRNGELVIGARTPVDEHVVAAGRKIRFSFEAAGYKPEEVVVTAREGQRRVPVKAQLEAGGTLRARANLPARLTVRGVDGCRNLELPARCPLANGRYTAILLGRKPALRDTFEVEIAGADLTRELTLGEVIAPEGHHLVVAADRTARRAAFLSGPRTLTLRDSAGAEHRVELEVPAGGEVMAPAP